MMDTFFSNQRDVWSGIEQALGEYDEKDILKHCRPDEEFDLDHSLCSCMDGVSLNLDNNF